MNNLRTKRNTFQAECESTTKVMSNINYLKVFSNMEKENRADVSHQEE